MEVAMAGMIAGAVGSGLSAVGSLEQGAARANEAHYRAQVAANNAMIAQQNAAYASAAGAAKMEAQGLRGRSQAGQIKTAQAASGIDVNTGSAVDVQASQREVNQLNVMNIGQEAALTNYGYRVQATGFEAEKGLAETEAAQARTAGKLGAVTSLLGGASSIGGKWAGLQY